MLVQHLLGLTAGLLVYLIGRRLFGPLVGLAAALLTVLDVELALYEHAVMTETLFTVLLLCAMALVLLRLPGSIWLKVAGFGLLAGAATLVRPTGLLLPWLGATPAGAGASERRCRSRLQAGLVPAALAGQSASTPDAGGSRGSGPHRGTGDGLE